MKPLKLFLAWLDWSTYARVKEKEYSCNYEFPKSLCPLAWRTLFSIVILPITWITHVWNLLLVSKETFRNEDSDTHKLNYLNTLLITIVCFMLGVFVYNHTDGEHGTGGWGWDWFHTSDPFIISYLKLFGCGIIGAILLAIAIVAFVLVLYLIHLAYTSITSKPGSAEGGSAISKTVHAIKNKYCPSIDWNSVRKKQK